MFKNLFKGCSSNTLRILEIVAIGLTALGTAAGAVIGIESNSREVKDMYDADFKVVETTDAD